MCFEKHSELYRKSNCSLPSSNISNFIENLLDYCQKDWPNCQIPGSWEILTFGFVLIWNEPSYFKITHKREVYREKIGIGNNDAWYFQNKILSPGYASFQPFCWFLQSSTMSQGWGWEPTLWDCWLQPGLPALPDSPFGSSKPTIPVSQADHQAHWQEARQFSSGKLHVVGCWLIEMFYVLTWNLLALKNQCFPVQWCAVRNLMISSNCHFEGQNLCWPESHNFLASTKYLDINTNKKAYSVLCSTTVKFARLFLGKGIMKKIPAFRAAMLGTHMSLFQPCHCCIN